MFPSQSLLVVEILRISDSYDAKIAKSYKCIGPRQFVCNDLFHFRLYKQFFFCFFFFFVFFVVVVIFFVCVCFFFFLAIFAL